MREGLTDFRLRLRGEDALLQVRGEQMDLARRLLEKRHEPLLDGFGRCAWTRRPGNPGRRDGTSSSLPAYGGV